MNGLLLNVGVVLLSAVFVHAVVALVRYQTRKTISNVAGVDASELLGDAFDKACSLVIRWTWTIVGIVVLWFLLFGNAWSTLVIPSKSPGLAPAKVEEVQTIKESAAGLNQAARDEVAKKLAQASKDNTAAMTSAMDTFKQAAEDAKNKKGQ